MGERERAQNSMDPPPPPASVNDLPKKLEDRFALLAAERLGMRRNVSFNNIAAFPSMPKGKIKSSNLNLSMLAKTPPTPPNFAEGGHTETPEPVFTTKQLVVVLVGLPARGKSYMSQALSRYLNWLGYHCRVFNVGTRRRKLMGTDHKAEFFNPNNEEGTAARRQLAMNTLTEAIHWLVEGGNVAVFDATNTTRDRRQEVYSTLQEHGIRVLFLESLCTDESIVERNITATKLFSPDYTGADPEEAVRDFTDRIANYERAYETVGHDKSEADYSYVKVVNAGKQLVLNEIDGFVQGKIVSYLMNTHIMPRTIYLSRHGESKYNVTGQLGGDPALTERGKAYAYKLAEFINNEFLLQGKDLPLVWTSQLKRTRQTVELIPTMNVCWRALNEIDAGSCEEMTYKGIQENMPEVHKARKVDKLRYRYPMGESYVDVIQRIEPVILELERQREPVLIVAHNAIIRAIYSYYMGIPQEECPNLDIPLHTVFKIVPRAYKCDCEVINLQVENTYNNKTPEGTPQSQSPQEVHMKPGEAMTPAGSVILSENDDQAHYDMESQVTRHHLKAVLDEDGNVAVED